MRFACSIVSAPVAVLLLAISAASQTVIPGAEEFGMTERELVAAVEKVESLIAECIRSTPGKLRS
jgi:hypothetical protein